VRAVEIPSVLHEAGISLIHAAIKTVEVPRRAQSLALIPVRIASRQSRAENLITAVGADNEIRTAMNTVNIGTGCAMGNRPGHEDQGRSQKRIKKQRLDLFHVASPSMYANVQEYHAASINCSDHEIAVIMPDKKSPHPRIRLHPVPTACPYA
jgi:hypothetical protein